MFKHPTILALGFVVATLLGTTISHAGPGAIRDNGGFFSESAKSEATRKLSEIEQKYKKDLVIETFKEIPEEIKQGVDLTDKAAMSRLFEKWTVMQAKQQRLNGVYILLTKEPAHIQIVVGNETQNKAFTLMDRDNLASLMLSKLRKKQNDEALLEGVNFVFKTMAGHGIPSNLANNVPSSSAAKPVKGVQTEQANPWGWIVFAVIGIVAIWLIAGIIRSVMGGRASTAGSGMSPGFGGGGIFGSLLGGMFGAAAGMWLYDQFSGNHGNAWGADQDNRSGGSTGFSGQDTDYSGTGGDFGGDSGGGDSGGDSGGGGDF